MIRKTINQIFGQVLLSISLLAGAAASTSAEPRVRQTAYAPLETSYKCRGRLDTLYCRSSQAKLGERRMFVYLPENYDNTTESYPVVYLLHGARGSETAWIEKGGVLHDIDSLTLEGKVKPMIVVFPNTNQYNNDEDYRYGRRKPVGEAFFEIDGVVESLFPKDVVGTVDSLYRTIRSKEGRAIAGLSIGALQAIFISANFPDMFDYVGMFSPMIKPAFKRGHNNGFYSGLKEKLSVQFSNPPRIYWIMAGFWDVFYCSTQQFDFYLNNHDYPHRYNLSGGGHTWKNWIEYCNLFLQNLWQDGE